MYRGSSPRYLSCPWRISMNYFGINYFPQRNRINNQHSTSCKPICAIMTDLKGSHMECIKRCSSRLNWANMRTIMSNWSFYFARQIRLWSALMAMLLHHLLGCQYAFVIISINSYFNLCIIFRLLKWGLILGCSCSDCLCISWLLMHLSLPSEITILCPFLGQHVKQSEK